MILKKGSKILLFLVIGAAVGAGLGYLQLRLKLNQNIQTANQTQETQELDAISDEAEQEEASPSADIFGREYQLTASQSGQTPFELITAEEEVEYEEFDAGVFINSINNLAGNKDFYWALYVNDEYAQKAADKIELEPGDTALFSYEEIELDKFEQEN